MRPDEIDVTKRCDRSVDPVNETETGAIELSVVTAATGKL